MAKPHNNSHIKSLWLTTELTLHKNHPSLAETGSRPDLQHTDRRMNDQTDEMDNSGKNYVSTPTHCGRET